ncbi:MAG: ABC transporter permease [Spirochaetales bacterium]|nr:ABC transporter permease [Spirochaetales bacterium]
MGDQQNGAAPAEPESKNKIAGGLLRRIPAIYISLALLLIFVLLFVIGSKTFLSVYNLKIIGNVTAILLTVGLGQAFVIMTGGIDLSVGGIISLTSVVYLLGLETFGYFSFVIAILVACTAGLVNGVLFTKARIPSFVCTLGTGGIFVSLTYLLHEAPISVPSRHFDFLDVVNGSPLGISNGWIIALGVAAVFFVIQRYTYLGRTIQAIGSNEKMSWMSGINVQLSKTVAFVLSGFGAGVAGIILASNLYSGSAIFGDLYVLESIAVVVVGGTAITGGAGGVLNTIVGALIMSVFKNGMTVVGIDVYAQQSFLGVLIIIAVAITFDRSKVITIK